MLNLQYLETGRLEQITKPEAKTRSVKRTAQAVCFDILNLIYKMNKEQNEFQDEIKGQRHCNVLQHYSGQGKGVDSRHEIAIKKIAHRLYKQDSMATVRRISKVLNMNDSNCKYYMQLLRKMEMIDYDATSHIYTIKPKGIEFTIVWEDVKRLFPYPFNVRNQ